MRPVTRKPNTKSVSNYHDYFDDLIENFGSYCSYCEVKCKPDIEHVVPQSKDDSLECSWNNLLLGCPSCNRNYKKNKNESRDGYVWPDEKDTYLLFTYLPSGQIKVRVDLADIHLIEKAQKTLELCGLDKGPADTPSGSKAWGWRDRKQAWDKAEEVKAMYILNNISLRGIVIMVTSSSNWSIWMIVFEDHPEVQKAISNAMPGTLQNYC